MVQALLTNHFSDITEKWGERERREERVERKKKVGKGKGVEGYAHLGKNEVGRCKISEIPVLYLSIPS